MSIFLQGLQGFSPTAGIEEQEGKQRLFVLGDLWQKYAGLSRSAQRATPGPREMREE